MAKSKPLAEPPNPIDVVFGWMVAGHAEDEITRDFAKRYPGEDLKKVLVAVVQRLEKAADLRTDYVTGWCIEATRDVYRQAIEGAELTVALKAIRQIWDFTR